MRPFQFVLIAAGLGLLLPFVLVVGQKIQLWSGSEAAVATVVRYEAEGGRNRRNGKPALFPVVRFTTDQGEVIVVKSPTGTNPPAYQVGEQVRLRYNPASPQTVELPDFSSQWLGTLGTGLFALLGGWLLRAALRQDPREHKKQAQQGYNAR